MTFALVTANTIQSEGGLPSSARILTGPAELLGGVVNDLYNLPVETQQACGYFAVTDTARPDDDAVNTYDRTIVLVANVPTETWTQRAKTADELTADKQAADRTAMQDAAIAYLTIAAPTTAQMRAQVQRLTTLQLGTP